MRKLINNIVFRKQKSRQVGRSGHAPQQRPQRSQPTMTLPACFPTTPSQQATPTRTPYVYLHK